jgi:hypothetical protein
MFASFRTFAGSRSVDHGVRGGHCEDVRRQDAEEDMLLYVVTELSEIKDELRSINERLDLCS